MTFTDRKEKHFMKGYIPPRLIESPTHFAVITAAINGTMYCRPPVNSNIITTRDTETEKSRSHLNKSAIIKEQIYQSLITQCRTKRN